MAKIRLCQSIMYFSLSFKILLSGSLILEQGSTIFLCISFTICNMDWKVSPNQELWNFFSRTWLYTLAPLTNQILLPTYGHFQKFIAMLYFVLIFSWSHILLKLLTNLPVSFLEKHLQRVDYARCFYFSFVITLSFLPSLPAFLLSCYFLKHSKFKYKTQMKSSESINITKVLLQE